MREYRHRKSGALGHRYGPSIMVPVPDFPDKTIEFKEDEWEECAPTRPLGRMQIGHITYEADRLLCRFVGETSKQWESLSDKRKQNWVKKGPGKPEIRRSVWLSLTETLSQKAD